MDIGQRAGQRPAPHVVVALAATDHTHTRPILHHTPRWGAAGAARPASEDSAEA